MKITERIIVTQEWEESEYTKTGWDSHGWQFCDEYINESWTIVEHVRTDKHYNPTLGIAERETEIEG